MVVLDGVGLTKNQNDVIGILSYHPVPYDQIADLTYRHRRHAPDYCAAIAEYQAALDECISLGLICRVRAGDRRLQGLHPEGQPGM